MCSLRAAGGSNAELSETYLEESVLLSPWKNAVSLGPEHTMEVHLLIKLLSWSRTEFLVRARVVFLLS